MERYLCLQPEYVSRFQCDGRLCRSKCCRDWGVNLDGASLKRYQGIEDEGIREDILSHVRQWEGSVYFELRENGWCPFLREDYLCRLQKELGEEYLSCTCRTFPRMIYRVEDMLERSLSLACPVAAELILTAGEPMGFETVEMAVAEPIVVRRPQESNLIGHLPEIQYACISLLQDRRFPLDGRLALLGSFLEQLQAAAGRRAPEALGDLAGFYTSEALEKEASRLFRAVIFRPGSFEAELTGLAEAIGASERERGIRDPYLENFLRAFGGQAPGTLAEAYERDWAAEAWPEGHRRILEQYLVNEFFVNIYPFRIKGTLMQNFHAFVLGYKLLEALLLATHGSRAAVAEGMLREALADFACRMDHGPSHMEAISERVLEGEAELAPLLNRFLRMGQG